MIPSTKTTIVATTQVSYFLGREELFKLFEEAGIEVPQGAHIYINIPGDGDYSNEQLSIDEDCPLVVCYQTITRSGEGSSNA
jgi:hypothetical protein